MDEEARAVGCVVVEAKDRDIFIDLDSQQDQYVMEAILALFRENLQHIEVVKISRSRNGNKHAYLRASWPLTATERVLLQAVLGSDRKREALAYLRILDNAPIVSCFFEKADADSSTAL